MIGPEGSDFLDGMENWDEYDFFNCMCDDDNTEAVSPMSVMKPSEEKLKKCMPDIPSLMFSQTFKHGERREGDFVYPVLIDEVNRSDFGVAFIPDGIVNKNPLHTITPNLFFRFQCRLFGVHCPLNTNGKELYLAVYIVCLYLPMFRRYSPSMVTPSVLTSFVFSSTRRWRCTILFSLLLASHCGVCWTW